MEDSEVNPQAAYAHCKIRVERGVRPMADDDFSPTFLRNAPAYGPSPRMRFDIVQQSWAGRRGCDARTGLQAGMWGCG